MVTIRNPNRFLQVPDAILFDTDNTLYHYDPAHAVAMKAVRELLKRKARTGRSAKARRDGTLSRPASGSGAQEHSLGRATRAGAAA